MGIVSQVTFARVMHETSRNGLVDTFAILDPTLAAAYGWEKGSSENDAQYELSMLNLNDVDCPLIQPRN